MHICMYIYIHTYIRILIYVYVYTYIFIYIFICIYIHIYLYLHTCKYIRTSVYICIYVHTHLHIYVNVHMSARLYESCKKIQRPDPQICPLGSGNSLVQNISVWSYWSGGNEKPTGLSNRTSTAKSCAEDQILENSILGTRFLIFVLNENPNTFLESIYQ